MAWKRWRLSLLVMALVLLGCDRSGQKHGDATTVQHQPEAAPLPVASTLPTTRPAQSSLLINGEAVDFPAARLMLQQKQPTVGVLLFSDDAAGAGGAPPGGNRYYFRIHLDIDEISQLPSADWNYQARVADLADEPDGIFLAGDKVQLQPYDVHIGFSQRGGDLLLQVEGLFVSSASPVDGSGSPKTVSVGGVLVTELEIPKTAGE